MGRWFGRSRRADEETTPQDAVEVWNDDDGLLVSGPSEAVESLVARLEAVGGSGVMPTDVAPTEALAVFATGFADGATSSQYIRHTPASRELLQQHGAIPDGTGGFRSLVHDGRQIAGNLDWEVVNVGPERALAFQSAAIGMALRTAVKQVEVAVERVEDKVDRIAAFLRADRLGQILGDRRTLENLAQRVDAGEGLASADWASVAALGPAIAQDLEKLRAHARSQITDTHADWRPRSRARAAESVLGDDVLAETLALIVVAEHNFSLWQRLRLAHIERTEPDHLAAAGSHARAALREHLDLDQRLLDDLRHAEERLLTPRSLDGLAVRQSAKLSTAEKRLDTILMGFAEHRGLEADPAVTELRPSLKDSLGHIGGWTTERLEPVRHTVRRRKNSDAEPELPELGDGSNIYED